MIDVTNEMNFTWLYLSRAKRRLHRKKIETRSLDRVKVRLTFINFWAQKDSLVALATLCYMHHHVTNPVTCR